MSELRTRMDNAMVLRGFADRTRGSYLACAAGLAKFYRRPPDTLNAEEIQGYLLHLITEKKLAYASVNQAACAFRFLFGEVLRQPAIRLDIPMAKVPKRLPLIFARDDVISLLAHCRNLRDRTVLETHRGLPDAGRRRSVAASSPAPAAGRPGTSITRAATGIARSARPAPRKPGSLRGGAKSCPCRTSTRCSRCRTISTG